VEPGLSAESDVVTAAESALVPNVAHSRIRFLLRATTFHLLTGFSVTGVCCGVPATFCPLGDNDVNRPRWWRTEAKRGIGEIESFLSSADRA
jgi:hypothetical protein